jgi:hypothetical protein
MNKRKEEGLSGRLDYNPRTIYFEQSLKNHKRDMTNEKEVMTQWNRKNKDEEMIWIIKRVVGLLSASIWRLELLGVKPTPNPDQETCNTTKSRFVYIESIIV